MTRTAPRPLLLLLLLLLFVPTQGAAATAFVGTPSFSSSPRQRPQSRCYSSGRPSTPDSATPAPVAAAATDPPAGSPLLVVTSPPTPPDDDERIVERVGFKDVEIRLPERFSPLERVALSAEGDLQRIISSFYNAPVAVTIKRCAEVTPEVFDREVDLSVLGRVFCTATSSLSPKTPECAHLLREQSVGLGQLFRYLRVYPTFRLLEVGRTGRNDEGFWRLYELDCPEVINCRIRETFAPDTFHRLTGGPSPPPRGLVD